MFLTTATGEQTIPVWDIVERECANERLANVVIYGMQARRIRIPLHQGLLHAAAGRNEATFTNRIDS